MIHLAGLSGLPSVWADPPKYVAFTPLLGVTARYESHSFPCMYGGGVSEQYQNPVAIARYGTELPAPYVPDGTDTVSLRDLFE